MNTLFFVKFRPLGTHVVGEQAVFLVTATDDDAAVARARERLTTPGAWRVAEVTAVCSTPDDVKGFEPC